jgi:NAD-dependent SIR2 family protein deacetylase
MPSPSPPPRRSSGHQVVHLKCLRCGHEGRVPPERLQEAASKGRRLRCRQCHGYAFQTTVVWHGGPPPDNVVPLKKNKKAR